MATATTRASHLAATVHIARWRIGCQQGLSSSGPDLLSQREHYLVGDLESVVGIVSAARRELTEHARLEFWEDSGERLGKARKTDKGLLQIS